MDSDLDVRWDNWETLFKRLQSLQFVSYPESISADAIQALIEVNIAIPIPIFNNDKKIQTSK